MDYNSLRLAFFVVKCIFQLSDRFIGKKAIDITLKMMPIHGGWQIKILLPVDVFLLLFYGKVVVVLGDNRHTSDWQALKEVIDKSRLSGSASA
jgi:hypothetical protein